ncbi:MAG: MarR family transcriptional regulator [Stenotrophomonas indicatrix]|jgi:DNA-binding MarR family transcriptional regulator|uniref:MarR family winged helix-turn-helix transcriptional regulator n=1 Tax=Stenotrophomonas indicatrix TaxID=2045451 RepID=UPI000C2621FC|nr:MarR family winged helix-turn-helix transcriptional regulator [Stenotrophomonas indicatrix]PJL12617.1 MarR family transcriptional regulator [Stenotrophomonas maltophilia]MDF2480322.1 MarR family transcriptional regulator [Stenotrophomonas indicatrix]PJL21643.1 MarR family transcriptional regulator [Stenotrophomonas maltophilia]QXQ04244.1 MarR family winged helix-turn-helix transcriptional regulator [Stenotrophomonas indicatrix]TPD95141.1 winged helix-turn-helix transcriptional regulator [St
MTSPTITPDEWAAWRGFRRMAEITSGRIVHDITRSTGLSSADFVVLMELSKAKDRCRRQRELLDYLEWDKTRLSHQLTRMAGRGLIERDTDSDNVVVIRMTAEGRTQLSAARPVHVASVRRNFLDHLSADDLAALQQITDKLHAALQDAEN